MSLICPTVLADNPRDYRQQIEAVEPFARRVQIDVMDGHFTKTLSVTPIQLWWPETMQADIHMMFAKPLEHIETLVSLRPHMVIIHAEAEGDLLGMIQHLQEFDIKVGVALLQETNPEEKADLIAAADHVLIFSGQLGHFGGEADLSMLSKVEVIKQLNPQAEIGWDGGASEENIAKLAHGGVDVINVGKAIQKSDDPAASYATLVSKLS